MATATRNLVAVTPGGDITDDMLAGYYVFYSIPEESIPLSRVRKAFKENGLDDSRLPDKRRGEHVMQDACSKAQRISENGKRVEIRAQQVGRTDDFLIYQMTRHVHDLDNRVIDHPKALRVLYAFEDGTLSFELLDGAKQSEVQSLIDEIQGHFDKNHGMLPGRGLRTILRHYIEAIGGEPMRDGVYFLARERKLGESSKLRDFHGAAIDGGQFIENLQNALRQIYKGEPEFHPVPCVNDEGQRAFLKRKFIENCTEELKEYRDECLELVMAKQNGQRTRSIRADKRARMVEQRREMDHRRAQFAEILGETLQELDRDMKLADSALSKFLTEAD